MRERVVRCCFGAAALDSLAGRRGIVLRRQPVPRVSSCSVPHGGTRADHLHRMTGARAPRWQRAGYRVIAAARSNAGADSRTLPRCTRLGASYALTGQVAGTAGRGASGAAQLDRRAWKGVFPGRRTGSTDERCVRRGRAIPGHRMAYVASAPPPGPFAASFGDNTAAYE